MFDNLFMLLGPAWSIALLVVMLLGTILLGVLHAASVIGDRGVRRAALRLRAALRRLRGEVQRAIVRPWDAPPT